MFRRFNWKTAILFSLLAVFTAIAGYFVYTVHQLADLPEIHQPQTSYFYYNNEELMTTRFVENRTKVSREEIPPEAVWATVAAEDKRFYEHSGFDFHGVLRAAYRNLQERSVVQGGSTITQQLAKNLYLSHERTWQRKFEEAAFTFQLERQLSKEEILEKYLNTVYYGHATYGIEAAARMYFDKPASELSLKEAALLAGLPRGPGYYSPFINREAAEERAAVVLNLMEEEDFIGTEEKEKALAEELDLNPNPSLPRENNYVVDHLVHRDLEQFSEGEEDILKSGGLEVFTTVDPELQELAEEVLQERLPVMETDHRGVEQPQGALVALDPETGHIKAMVGGKNYQNSMLNRALSQRSPGSAFKPFTYAAALENGYTAASTFKCEPVSFSIGEGTYKPSDFGGGYHYDELTLREALVESCNITALKLHRDLGIHHTVEIAERLGIESKLGDHLSLPLGTNEVTLWEITSAYATFANGGYRVEPRLLDEAVNADGEVLAENQNRPGRGEERLLDPAIAYLVTDMLKGVLSEEGTAAGISHLIEFPAAGKTGTSQDYKDAYMVGYTPELVVGVYVGHDHGEPLGQTGGQLAAPVWAEFMQEAHANTTVADFNKPDGIRKRTLCPETGQLQHRLCSAEGENELFLEGTAPQEDCRENDCPEVETPWWPWNWFR